MMSKLEHSLNNLPLAKLICPYCFFQLNVNGSNLYCENNHNFNIKKNGSIFLLKNANYKSSRFYTKNLFLARRNFILQGYYTLVIDEIIMYIKEHLKNGKILDLGCGEGTITNVFAKNLKDFFLIGIDYSKDAIDLATDYLNDNSLFLVGDVNNIPVEDNSVDVVLDFLSPFSSNCILKVLKEDGFFIKVIPTKNYLKELRDIYNLDNYENKFLIKNDFEIVERKVVEKKFFNLKIEDQNYLATMTPLTWKQEKVKKVKEITISLEIIVLKKRS